MPCHTISYHLPTHQPINLPTYLPTYLPSWLVARVVHRSLCRSNLGPSPLAPSVSRSASRSVCGVGLGPTSGVEWGCAPLLGGPHERGRMRAGTPQPHKPSPQSLARIRPRSWGGARWGATSAWCALGNLRDFGGGLAASDVAKVRKELPARRLAAAQSLRALRDSQAAWHPATATQRWLARKLLENPFEASRPPATQPPPTASALAKRARGSARQLCGWGVSDDLKGFSRGKMDCKFTF